MDVRAPFKDSVVETFLRRKLTFVQFETLRYYSAAAVCDAQTRNLRFVVVLADAVYSTENVNPCTLRCELPLARLLQLQQVHDFADFLSGNFRNHAQHVLCLYRMPRARATARTRAHTDTGTGTGPVLNGSGNVTLPVPLPVPLPIPVAQSLTYADSLQNEDQDAETQRLLSDSSRRKRSASAFRKLFPVTKKPLPLKPASSNGSTLNNADLTIASESTVPNQDTAPAANATVTAELHLYELVPHAHFFYVMQSTAFNYALEHAYVFEDCQTSDCGSDGDGDGDGDNTQMPFAQAHLSAEKTRSLFGQLLDDIVHAGSQQESFELINELKVACSRYFVVRRQFWRTADLFAHLVDLLQQISARWGQQIADQHYANDLEYGVLILETLSACLRGTDAYLSRMDVLLRNNGARFRQLVVLITRVPVPTLPHAASKPGGDDSKSNSDDFLRIVKMARSAQEMHKHAPRVRAGFANADAEADADADADADDESGTVCAADAVHVTETEVCQLIADYVAAGASVLHQLILGCRFMQQLDEQAYSQRWIQDCIEHDALQRYCEMLLLHLIHVYLIPPKSCSLKMTRSLSMSVATRSTLQHGAPLSHIERAYLCEELLLLRAFLKSFGYKDTAILQRLNSLAEVELKYFANSHLLASRLIALHDDKLQQLNDSDSYLNAFIVEELENLKSSLASH